MKRLDRCASALIISILLLVSQAAQSQGNGDKGAGRSFGLGQPVNSLDLPPGQLRRDIENLPVHARENAIKHLQNFSFPEEDLASLRVNAEGAIWYEDRFDGVTAGAAAPAASPVEINHLESDIFSLHSSPGSGNVVYLDFDGHTIEPTSGWTITQLVALPFDPSGNDSPATEASFTQDELNRIFEIWHRISEDFASFDIDVTTEEPVDFTPTTGHVLFTDDTDAFGEPMPGQGNGGIAFTNAFGRDDYVSRYSPALVYYTNLSAADFGMPTLNAEAASHEFGHNLGLSHDGIAGGSSYYEGHGSGFVSWAPIMGRPFTSNVTQWSKGEYPDANNTQDDLAVIAGKLGWDGDDHGDSAALATPLLVEPDGSIQVSSPELDPDNVLPENKGIINDRVDVDWYYFDVTEAGALNITATPAWHSFTRNANRGANLDIELALFNSGLVLLTAGEPDDDTNAAVAISVTAGRHYLQVRGVGNTTYSDYSDYASMGMYFLEGNIPVGAIDETPPSPSVMSWETAPAATGTSTISMTAVLATDDSGTVEYYFSCVAGGQGCAASGWQTSRSHTASGLTPNTYYAYTVKARDAAGNQNDSSPPEGDTTDSPPANQPPVATASYAPEPAVISRGKTLEVTLDGSASSDPDGTISAWSWKDADGAIVSESVSVTVKLREGDHDYTLEVTDDNGATSSTSLSITVTKQGKGKPPG